MSSILRSILHPKCTLICNDIHIRFNNHNFNTPGIMVIIKFKNTHRVFMISISRIDFVSKVDMITYQCTHYI